MLNAFRIAMFFFLFMPFCFTSSFAYEHGGGGHHGGGGGHHGYRGYDNFTVGFDYSTYYNNFGYYYPYTPSYYESGVLVSSPIIETSEVITQPTTVVSASTYPITVISTPQNISAEIDNDITLNIPNNAGGYSTVEIKKSGKGFIGPQGEYYPEFPKVSVLKVLYGN